MAIFKSESLYISFIPPLVFVNVMIDIGGLDSSIKRIELNVLLFGIGFYALKLLLAFFDLHGLFFHTVPQKSTTST